MQKVDNLQYVAIQIKSHGMETGFYKPEIGRGFGWQREREGRGGAGFCVCEKCGYKIAHQRGTPCSSLKCPNCDINLKRE
jgi:hypothetical protein